MTTVIDPSDRVLDPDDGALDAGGAGAGDAPTFASLGVDPALVKALAAQGITTTFAIQAMTVADALAGRDVCGKAKTGSGKTLAFGVPLLQRTMAARSTEPGRPRALVLVPTRELAVQVSEVLEPLAKEAGLRIAAVYGGADIERQVKKLRRGVDVIIATPGRLIDLGDRGELSVADIETLVLDEADRMADMGFMPQVEWVLRRLEREHQTLLFSATLDGAVDRLVSRYLTDPVMHEVASPRTTVDAMEHRFLEVHQMDRVKVCAAICRNSEKTLVFVRTKRGADRLVEQLRKEGVRADAIHGDLRQTNRERTLKDFGDGKLPALVATDVAARGLDIDMVDVVVHFDPPEDHKAYLHRSGRTARAGEAGLVVTLVQWNQILEVERIQTRIGLKVPDRRDLLQRPPAGRPGRVAAGHRLSPAGTDPPATPPGPPIRLDRRDTVEDRTTEERMSDTHFRAPMTVGAGIEGIERILVVTAHPDDVDFGAAGSVAVWTGAGIEVAYCIVTDGDAGGSDRSIRRADMAVIRRQEQLDAAKVVGRDRRDLSRVPGRAPPARPRAPAGHHQGDPQVPPRPGRRPVARAQLVPDLRQPSRPPGRRRGGRSARSTRTRAIPSPSPSWSRKGSSPIRSPRCGSWPPTAPTGSVDATEFFDRKLAALRSHRSQVGDGDHLDGLLRSWMSGTALAAGLPEGRLAEAFHVVATGVVGGRAGGRRRS